MVTFPGDRQGLAFIMSVIVFQGENGGERMTQLRHLQKEVFRNKCAKGFNTSNVEKELCLIQGELAEVYQAYLKKDGALGEELADVAIYLLGLSEMLKIDLQKEIEQKISINDQRQYEVIEGVLTRTYEPKR